MDRTRYCDDSCPFYYCDSYTDDFGCRIFGPEFKRNKKMEDDLCYVHPKKLEYLAHRENVRDRHLEKESNKYRKEYRKPVTDNKFVYYSERSQGYTIIGNNHFIDSVSRFYRPDMKGGHIHNHVYNKCNKHLFRGRSRRKIDRKDKLEFVKTFHLNVKLGNVTMDSLIHTIFYHNKKNNP